MLDSLWFQVWVLVPAAIAAPRWDHGMGPWRFAHAGLLLVQRPGQDLGQLLQVASHQGVHVEAVGRQLVHHVVDERICWWEEKESTVTSKGRAE